jgi:AcrR family transcriptional regulator
MPRKRRTVTSSRRKPVQARSTQLVADILQAAIHVLERVGPHKFTTIRVAETAGVSIGSIYQYFPNKQAILHRLQLDEWEKTGETVDGILGDDSLAAPDRLRALFRAFFQSECDEGPLRLALASAAPRYHDAPESRAGRTKSQQIVGAFIASAAPHASPRQRRFATQLLFLTMTAMGKQVSELRPTGAEIQRWADAGATMVTMYLTNLNGGD